MTVRTERAVRADPGATSGRRDSGWIKTVDASASAIPPRNVLDTRRQITPEKGGCPSLQPRLTRELTATSEVEDPLMAINGQGPSPEHKRFPQAVVRNPYALIYVLEQHRGSFEIALLLYREGEVSKYRMRQQLLPRQKAIDQALLGLMEMGLVEFECSRAFPFEKRYRLTPRGKEFVASSLRDWPQTLPE